MVVPLTRLFMESAMVIGKPAPCVSAVVDAVDEAIREQNPSDGRSTMPRAWLALCVTAVLITHAIGWARFARASLGTDALAALSWRFRHRKMPGELLLVASVRVIRRQYGMTAGSLVIDDTDTQRSKSATTRAHLDTRRDQESGGYMWGQRLVFLVLVTPQISIPVGVVCYQPAPELSPWDKKEKALKQQGVPPTQRPPTPAPHPPYPPNPPLARRFLEAFKAQHPDIRMHWITADALYGTAPFVDDASARFGGVQVISQIRRHQHLRLGQRAQPVADYCATQPGTPSTLRIRGGDEVVVWVSRARVDVCAHHTKRCIVAITSEAAETYRDLMASDLSGRTREMVQGHTLRWLVEVFMQDWKSYDGWSPLTQQPGEAGARPSVILRLLVDQALCLHPDPHAQLQNTLPA
jgi:hypothetical protein